MYIPILKTLENNSIEKVLVSYSAEEKQAIKKFISFLIGKNYMFYTDSLEQWGEYNLEWKARGEITNGIIDLVSGHFFFKNSEEIINSYVELGCRFLQFRLFDGHSMSFEDLQSFLRRINNSNLFSAQILVGYNETIGLRGYEKFIDEFNKLNFQIFNCPSNIFSKFFRIKTIEKNIKNETCCGVVSKNLFEVNPRKYTESLKYNSCLNRKISIDRDGNIKNCPSMANSFGNIKYTDVKNAVSDPNLKRFWDINKDKIDICKDCEFRYICTDCRAYVKNPNNPFSKPLKCGYNPYDGKWQNWSTNPLSKHGIDYYNIII